MSQSLLQPHDKPNDFHHSQIEYRSQPNSQPQILSSRSLTQQPPTAPRSGEQNYQKLIELAVQRMRSLENKYEKLSLFYQDELNQQKQQISSRANIENQTTHSSARRSDGNTKSAAVGSVILAQPSQLGGNLVNSGSLHNLSSSGLGRQSNGLNTQREESVLSDIRSEKQKFDDAINFLMREAPYLDTRQSEGPNDQNIGAISLTNDEVLRFNGELQGAFIDLLNHIEQCQSSTVNCIQAKQTEMFSLSNKYRMPTNFRSECVSIWCDTKAQITQNIQQTRAFLHEKGLSLIAQSAKPINTQANSISKDRYSILIDKFEQDLVALKRSTLYYQNNVLHTKNVIKNLDDSIKTDRNRIKIIFNELMDTVSMSNDILLGRATLQNDVGSLNQQNYGDATKNTNSIPSQAQNNLDKRLNNYARSAINRPNSRSSGLSGGQLQRPPLQNQPQSNLIQRRNTNFSNNQVNSSYGMNNGLISPSRASLSGYSQNTLDQEWHPDLWTIRNRLIEYENQVSSIIAEVNEKEALLEDINILEDKQINEKLSQFLQTHDTDLVKQYFTNTVLTPTEVAHIVAQANLKAIQNNQLNTSQKDNRGQSNSRSPIRNTFGRSVSPYRGNTGGRKDNPSTPTQEKKSTPIRYKQVPQNYNQPHQKTPSHDNMNNSVNMALGSNAEQLYVELKRANQKVFEQQADIRKLKDQIQVLNIQAEDLRLTNNRIQIQSQNYSKQLTNLNQKLNSKTGSGPSNKSASSQQVQSPISKQWLPNHYSQLLQERDELINVEKDLCQRVDQFFTAMKLLQRAVNKKEDISELKVEFEQKQRSLQKASKDIQQRISFSQNPLNIQQTQSVISGSDNSIIPSGASIATNSNQNLRNRSYDNRGGTNTASVSRDKQKKGDTLQKQQIQEQIPSPLRPIKPPASVGYANRISGSLSTQTYSPKPQTIQEAEKMNSSNINNVSQGSFQSGGPLRSNNQNQTAERKHYEFDNSDQDKNFNHLRQVKNELQHLVIGHQQSVAQLAKQLTQWSEQMSPACYKHLHEIFATLDREIDLTLKHALSMDKEEQNRPNSVTKLRDLLIHKIQGTETQMADKLKTIQRRLEQRESELDSVKSLFVEKLKVLESNFAEISEHLLRSQQLQQELEEAKQEVQKHKEEAFDQKSKLELTLKEQKEKQQESNKFFNQYLNEEQEEIIKEQERQIEELSLTNNQLQEQLVQQKQKCKKHIEESEYLIYKSQISKYEDQIKKESVEKRDLLKNLENLQKEQENLHTEIQKIKSEKMQLNSDLLKAKEGLQQSQIQFEKKEMVVAQSVRDIEAKLKQTQELNAIAEKESRENTAIIKALEEENELINSELDEIRHKAIQIKQESDQQKQKLKNEIEEYEQKMQTLSQQLLDKENQLQKLMQDQDEVIVIKEELGEKTNAIFMLKDQINDLELNLAEAQSQQIELSASAQDQLENLKNLMNKQIREEQQKLAKFEADKEIEQNKLREELEQTKELEKQKLKEELEKSKKDEQIQLKSELEKAKELEKQELKEELEEAKMLEQQKWKEELEKAKQDEQHKLKQELEKTKEQELNELQSKLLKEKEIHLEEKEIKKSKEAENMMQLLKTQFLKQLADKSEELQRTKEELEQIQSNFKITDQKKQQLEQLVKEKEEEFFNVKLEVENVKGQFKKEKDQVEQKYQQEKENLEEINKIALDEKEQILFQQKEILESKQALEIQKEEIQQSAFLLSQEVQELQAKLESIEQAKDHFQKKLQVNEPLVTQLQNNLKESKEDLQQWILKAENFEKIIKKLEEQKSQSQKEIVSSELQFKEQELENLKEQLTKVKELIEVQKKELTDKNVELDKINKEQEQKVNELISKLQKVNMDKEKYDELEEENSEIKELLAEVKKKEQTTNNKNKELEQSLVDVVALCDELTAFKTDQQKQKPIQDELINSLQAQIKQHILTVESLNKQLHDTTELKDILYKDKQILDEKVNQLNRDYQSIDQKYQDSVVQLEKAEQEASQVQQLKLQVKELQGQNEQLQTLLDDNQQIQSELEAKLQAKEIDENKIKIELQEITKKSTEIIEQQKQLQTKLLQKQDEIKKMEQDHKEEIDKSVQEFKKTQEELENNKKESNSVKEKLQEVNEQISSQKLAYETILDQLEQSQKDCQEFERQTQFLKKVNTETEERARELEEQIEYLQQSQGQSKHNTRNSIGSDGDEYSSVAEMKDHLKHARQLLIQFITKLPYSHKDNEAMLPVVFSMFEFTKEEQNQAFIQRQKFNEEQDDKQAKDKAKSVFNKMWGGKKDGKDGKQNKSGNRIPTDHSFNSGNGQNR